MLIWELQGKGKLFTCENFTKGYLFVQILIQTFLVNKLLYIGYLTMHPYLLDNFSEFCGQVIYLILVLYFGTNHHILDK